MNPQLLFSDYFSIDPAILDKYGALNICIEADLPLFIDPFLLFSSDKKPYKELHEKIVSHLIILKEVALETVSPDLNLFKFPEVKQNWLGVCKWGNDGRGLGPKFAKNLVKAFNGFYRNFGEEQLTESSHIEKLTLVGAGIGKDFISDFTANLALEYLLGYTQKFATKYLPPEKRKTFAVRCVYDKKIQIWQPKSFELPYFYKKDRREDFILLTPLDILSKDEAFICNSDFASKFSHITNSLENSSLRDAVNSYFVSKLPANPKKPEINLAIEKTVLKFPEILDYYIKYQEKSQGRAVSLSAEKVDKLRNELISTLGQLYKHLASNSAFYSIQPTSYQAALQRALFLKNVIENNDGYRIFYKNGQAIAAEDTIQRIFRLTWFASPMDVNSEVNNGRGPADYKISYGDRDSTIVEFKLGSSTSLKKNLLEQTEIYKKASKSINDIKVILCYTSSEIAKVKRILKSIKQEGAENVVIIDATRKVSASKA